MPTAITGVVTARTPDRCSCALRARTNDVQTMTSGVESRVADRLLQHSFHGSLGSGWHDEVV